MKLFDVYPLYEVSPTKAKDVYVYDEAGTEYLDLYGGHAVISIGQPPPLCQSITRAIAKNSFLF